MEALLKLGFTKVNESKVSGMLSKIGAARTRNAKLELVSFLPIDTTFPTASRVLKDISYNQTILVIHTSWGSRGPDTG